MKQPLIQSSGTADPGEKPNPTNVGGQAVIEGVMMRAPGALSIVCRRQDGSLVLRERTVPAAPPGLFRLPFFRGVHTLVSSLRIGHQALRWSAEILEEDLAKQEAAEKAGAAKRVPPGAASIALLALTSFLSSSPEQEEEAEREPKKAPAKANAVAAEEPKSGSGLLMALPMLFAIGLFIALPQLAAEGINAWLKLGLEVTSPGFQAITGGSKLIIVISYLAGIRMIPEVRRVFQYHGAEHKSISTYEAKRDLIVAEARPTSALHARCGTTFIIMVAFVSVFVFSAVGAFLPPLPGGRLLQSVGFFFMKLPLLPVIAGITFELQRFFARYCSTGPLQFLLWPGFLVQKITTAEPDDDQLEVALASLRSALANASVELPKDHEDRAFESYDSLISDPAYRAA